MTILTHFLAAMAGAIITAITLGAVIFTRSNRGG